MKWKLSVSGAKFPWRLYGRKLPCFFLDSEGCQQSLVFLGLLTHHSNLCLSLYHHLPCGSVSLCLYVSILKGHQLLDLGSILIQYACMLSHLVVSLCNPTDHNTAPPRPPGSSVHGILQARILECVAISSFWFRDWTHISYISCIGRLVPYH